MHEKLGFEQVAMFPQVGFKHDGWVHVAYWQIVL
jgi:phosphinothricin acetyltransferase